MDWTVYWFQGLACFVFATAATFSGITGAALMLPWFLLGFPLLGVPEITTHQAIAAALFLEGAAFSVAIYRYAQRGLIDLQAVKLLALTVLPAAVIGALVSYRLPEDALRFAYGLMMLAASALLLRRVVRPSQKELPLSRLEPMRELGRPPDAVYRFRPYGLRLQAGISGGGGFLTGLISTGIGELTVPGLIARSRYPVAVVAATSIVLVAVADISAVLTHMVQFIAEEGLGAVPWNLVVWGVPGMAAGAYLGSHLQGRFSERKAQWFFVVLFMVIGVTFLGYATYES